MLPYSPQTKLDAILEFCRTSWSSSDHTLQKKGYRCFEELIAVERETTRAFMMRNLPAIKSALIDAGKLAKSAAKGYRLRCFLSLVKLTGSEDPQFMKDIFAEVSSDRSSEKVFRDQIQHR